MPAAISSILFSELGFWHKLSKSACLCPRASFKLAIRTFSTSSKVFSLVRKYFSWRKAERLSAVQSRLRKIFSCWLKAKRFWASCCSAFFYRCICLRSRLKSPCTKIFFAIAIARWGEIILRCKLDLRSRVRSYSFFKPKKLPTNKVVDFAGLENVFRRVVRDGLSNNIIFKRVNGMFKIFAFAS